MAISVITVCFNTESTISRTIESVLNQTHIPKEYIFVDGHSFDNTLDVIRSYIPKLERRGISVKLISEKDSGIYEAMNKGIKNASGELIGIVNADDYYEEDALETVWNAHQVNPNSIKYGMLKMYKDGKLYLIKQHTIDFIHMHMPQHPTWFVPKTVYDKIGLFDESFKIAADYDFACRAVKANIKFTRIEKVITHFFIGGLTSKYLKKSIDESASVKIKYGYLKEKSKEDVVYTKIRNKSLYWFEKIVLFPFRKIIFR